MRSSARTVEAYLASLPDDRREALEAVRAVILENLDDGYEEGMQYGMIGYYVPHDVYPAGYHCDPKQPLPFASLASQKNHMAIYLMCLYGDEAHESWFRKAWAATGRRLDMGKSCVRFKHLEDVALDVLGETIRRVPAAAFIAHYEEALAAPRPKRKGAAKKAKAKKATSRTSAKKKPVKKKTAAKNSAAKKKPAAKKKAPRRTSKG